MKFYIILMFVLLIRPISIIGQEKLVTPFNCLLLEQFIGDSVFQNSGPSSVLSADTIYVWDPHGDFLSCIPLDVKGTPIDIKSIRNEDAQFYKHIPALEIYNYHFIIYMSRQGNVVELKFFKKHSNHHGVWKYQIQNGKFVLIQSYLGQY